ncbi:MAG: serine/threonine-protein phosphatase [Alphaproteobacteria bacterium]|nr:serine/threonine-protein phosphatase [Alphaproteobacteria bacterium]
MAQGYGYRSEQRLRKENQDTHGVFELHGFTVLVVCDGMGGHVGGRQASSIAVRTIHDELAAYQGNDVRSALRRAIEAANRAIYEMARKNYRLMGMGTTCVAAAVQGNVAHVAHVGDSRCYLVREGQIRAVTRDHTMVNLFVDAELLSPEDAATHPEAHVLSRSLGVERQVEVDLAEPLNLQTGDRVLLCSDGVHGVIGTAGLGSVDWRNPQEGVDAAIATVERADGDDNATLVAFGLGISGASAPVTIPPDLASLEEEARQAPMQVSLQPVRRPTIIPSAGQHEGDVVALEDLEPAPQATTPVAPAQQAGKGSARGGVPWRLVGAAAAALLLALMGGGLLLMARSTTPAEQPAVAVAEPVPEPVQVEEPPAEAAAAQVMPMTEGQTEILLASSGNRGMFRTRCLDCTASFALPTSAAYLSGDNDPEVAIAFFAPDVPPPPRRVPNTTSVYDHPPPSGPEQTKAVRAARNKRCREALDTVRFALQKSIDYASLYGAAWYCFNDTHTSALARSRASTWESFRPLLVHFEGERRIPPTVLKLLAPVNVPEEPATPPEPAEGAVAAAGGAPTPTEREPDPAATPEAPAMPDLPDIWQIPATGGVEYRLALFELDGDVQGFRDIMVDLLGEPVVADHLASDILLEATAAASVARMEDPTPEALQVWARRVYIASRAMTGPVGELIRANRPEIAGLIEALLFEATGGDEGLLAIEEGFVNEAVPPVVARAQAAGLAGEMPNLDELDALVMGDLPPPSEDGADQAGSSGRSRTNVVGTIPSGRRGGPYRRRRTDPSVSTRDGDGFDWESFGYLKVYYPRQRMRVLIPYQPELDALDAVRQIQMLEGMEVYGGNEKMDLDEDWEVAPDAR